MRHGEFPIRIALDTNRYTDLRRKEPNVAGALDQVDQIFLPFVVIAELRAGFSLSRRLDENEYWLQEFLSEPKVSVLYPDDQTTHRYAALYRQLRLQGTPIPENDLWIAALVVQHDLALYSRDDHFHHLPQIKRI